MIFGSRLGRFCFLFRCFFPITKNISQKLQANGQALDENIAALNLKPVIDEILPVINLIEGENVSFEVTFQDPNDDEMVIEVNPKSLGDFESKPGVGKFSWLAPSGQKDKEYDLAIKQAGDFLLYFDSSATNEVR